MKDCRRRRNRKWDVKEGDTIQEDDTLVEIQNDKSVEEIPSPVTGKILKILVQEGTVARVGDVLVEIDAPGHEDDGGAAPAAKLHQKRLQLRKLHLQHQQAQVPQQALLQVKVNVS